MFQLVAQQAPNRMVFIVAALIVFFFLALLFVLVILFLSPWLKCFLSGAPISVFDLLGMRLRRTNVKQIVECRIMATQAGHPVPVSQLEQAYLSGADLKKVTMAFIESNKLGKNFTFEELVDAERGEKLNDMLNS